MESLRPAPSLGQTLLFPPLLSQPTLISAQKSGPTLFVFDLGLAGGFSLQLDSDDLLDAPVEAQSAFYEGPGVSGWPLVTILLEQKKLQRPEGKPGHALGWGSGTKLSHHPGHREGQRLLTCALGRCHVSLGEVPLPGGCREHRACTLWLTMPDPQLLL